MFKKVQKVITIVGIAMMIIICCLYVCNMQRIAKTIEIILEAMIIFIIISIVGKNKR